MAKVITLLTDFGTQDSYVAQMKGVLLDLCPEALIVDTTHEIRSQDVSQAARMLPHLANTFPAGTIHIAVVDPGVGTKRRVVAAKIFEQIFVLPDNGLLSRVLDAGPTSWCVEVDNPRYWRDKVSSTFHGRDIMAPVAAHLASGVDWQELGTSCSPDSLVRLKEITFALPSDVTQGILDLVVVDIDRFGNIILNATTSVPTTRERKVPSSAR